MLQFFSYFPHGEVHNLLRIATCDRLPNLLYLIKLGYILFFDFCKRLINLFIQNLFALVFTSARGRFHWLLDFRNYLPNTSLSALQFFHTQLQSSISQSVDGSYRLVLGKHPQFSCPNFSNLCYILGCLTTTLLYNRRKQG